MYKKNLIVGSSFLSFFILIYFVSYYTIPPLVDFQAHVALGMVGNSLLSFYQYQPSITYRLLDTIICFWHFILGDHYARVDLASYLSTLVFIFGSFYIFCRWLLDSVSSKAFCIIAYLSGPVFLMLHTTLFIEGVIPYTLAVFMAALSGAALWKIDNDIATQPLKIVYINIIIFLMATLLAIYSHLAGFLYCALAWIVPAIRVFFIKKNRWIRIGYLLFLVALLCGTALWINHPIGPDQNTSEPLLSQLRNFSLPTPLERIDWLLSGGPYQLDKLISTDQQGLLGNEALRILLTGTPFLVLLICACLLKKAIRTEKNHWGLFFIAQLFLSFLLIVFILPNKLGELRTFYSRHWIFIIAWTSMSMIYLLHQVPFSMLKKGCYWAPLLTGLCCFVLNPLYANFRQMPIEKVASDYTHRLLKAVNSYKEQHPELNNKNIIIDYNIRNIGNKAWRQYHIVPFIMMLSPKLIHQHIIIREHWGNLEHLPITWKTQSPSSAVYLRWKNETNQGDINLVPASADMKMIFCFKAIPTGGCV